MVADLTEGSVDFCQLLPLLQIGLDKAAEVLPVIPAQLPGTVNGQAKVLWLGALSWSHP